MSPREILYPQLPAVYRRRDAELGGPMRALLAVIDEQLQAVQADIETTWDNWFVETTEEWLVPYLGQALGLPVARDVKAIAFSRRALVANTIGYRRRKGTAAMLEQLGRDLTNYPARVVELFTRMAWNESMHHPTGRHATVDLRSTIALERIGGPFEEVTRTADVRRIASGRGLHNLPNVGLFLWRTQVWPLMSSNAASMGLAGQSAYRFSPLGEDRAIYAALVTETDPAAIATEASVPLALSRRRLWEEARRRGTAMTWPFSIAVHGRDGVGDLVVRDVDSQHIDVCDLSAIEATPATPDPDRVEVDPQTGRLVVGSDLTADLTNVEVVTNHYLAAAGQLGAGPWDRDEAAQDWLSGWTSPPEGREVGFQVMVLREGSGTDIVSTLDLAIEQWNDHLAGLADDTERGRALGLILVGDSLTHGPPSRIIELPSGAVLGIFAATWPESPDPGGGPSPVRLPGSLAARAVRPVVQGNLRVRGAATSAPNRGQLAIGGLVVSGRVRVLAGSLQGIALPSTTVLDRPALDIDTSAGSNASLEISLARSIANGIQAMAPIGAIDLADSAITGDVAAPETPATAKGTTVLGLTHVSRLSATDCILAGLVTVEEHQEGCVRFSYVPVGSRTPRRFRCQPDLALEAAESEPALAAVVPLRVRPRFVSVEPFAPGFLLLDPGGPPEIAGGAEDGGEPGSWNHLQHGIRLANLRNALPQFLRFGLEPGIFFLV
ncbi:MAG: phage tail protein [Polyangiaceae bacterium]